MEVMENSEATLTAEPRPVNTAFLDDLAKRIAADEDARFAISLDGLAYAKDSYQLGFDLVRIFARSNWHAPDPGPIFDETDRLLRGLTVLTGRKRILDRRYGELAVEVRDAGGSLFDFQDDSLARKTVSSIAAADEELARRVLERAGRAQATHRTV